MTELAWQPVRGYGICYVATASGLIFETGKLKSGYYYFTACRILSGKESPRLIYDSRIDVFSEKTKSPGRIREIAFRWFTIREGQR